MDPGPACREHEVLAQLLCSDSCLFMSLCIHGASYPAIASFPSASPTPAPPPPSEGTVSKPVKEL
jgi:hypothetical protein